MYTYDMQHFLWLNMQGIHGTGHAYVLAVFSLLLYGIYLRTLRVEQVY